MYVSANVMPRSIQVTDKSILPGLARGLACRCPNCGRGKLFRGYLKVRSPCDVCGNDNAAYPLDDFPPYLTILAVGHLVVPLLIWTDLRYVPPVWMESAIWLPLTVILCLLLLPRMKGATAGLCWALGLLRADPALPATAPAARS
jgi:uncharacterized protein (DUF983 family)